MQDFKQYIFPDNKFANYTNSHDPGAFGSTAYPEGPNTLPNNYSNNAVAANASRGGSRKRTLKNRIKKIYRKYKMAGRKSTRRKIKKLRRSLKGGNSCNNRGIYGVGGKRRRNTKRQHGGWAQYQNNAPITQVASLGGHLNSHHSALANPPPYQVWPNTGNCTDNYNHYTGKGFASRGH